METYGKILLIAMPVSCHWFFSKSGMVGPGVEILFDKWI